MKVKQGKLIFEILFWMMLAATAGHAVWALIEQPANVGGVALNMPSYVLPIAVFAWARKELKKEAPKWGIADTVCGGLFALCAIAMVAFITVRGALNVYGFISVYLNVALVFLIPISVFGVVWLMVRIKPRKEDGRVAKLLYALPALTVLAMLAHVAIDLIKLATRDSMATSFPWWTGALLLTCAYLPIALVLCGVYAIYRWIKMRK